MPKKDGPETVSDFRPISLMNITLKVITKILANRLQMVILRIVHRNQYGFIRSRTIQDCLAWSYEYIHQCHHSRGEIIILKLDFEMAFDTVEHSTIIQIMLHMGFPDRWLLWVQAILSSGSSDVCSLMEYPASSSNASEEFDRVIHYLLSYLCLLQSFWRF